MAIALNVALEHLKTVCSYISGMHAERVHAGPIEPSRIGDAPRIVIVQDKNRGERIDGNKTTRQIKLRIAVLMRIDPAGQDPDIQINEIYEPMHAELEQLIDGVDGVMVAFNEVEDSLNYETEVIEGKPLRQAYADWNLIIDRTVGQTDLAS